mmetsp:Transcript_2494/g.5576  ORF Transcript_2494/g.5576 Transcript_2494/m.5576 type:complete len:83 (+) Transcript_2494:370-618(+)
MWGCRSMTSAVTVAAEAAAAGTYPLPQTWLLPSCSRLLFAQGDLLRDQAAAPLARTPSLEAAVPGRHRWAAHPAPAGVCRAS